jgi:prepilin-type N-terminal cleavage/methylation domain-containing protein
MRSRRRRGMTLIETAVAVALLAVIVVSVVSGFSSIAIATKRHQEQTQVDRLVRSQAEYVKSQAYQTKPAAYPVLSQTGYTISEQILYFDPATVTFSTANPDIGLEEIVVTVTGPSGGSETLDFLKVHP